MSDFKSELEELVAVQLIRQQPVHRDRDQLAGDIQREARVSVGVQAMRARPIRAYDFSVHNAESARVGVQESLTLFVHAALYFARLMPN